MALNKLKYISTTPVEFNSLKLDTGVVVAQSNTNTFLGFKSQQSLAEDTIIEGPNNTGIGYAVMTNNPSTRSSTGVGARALAFLTTGNFNTAVGSRSMENLSTGESNTAVGTESMVFLSTGNQNTALGFQALAFSNGSSNVAIGHRSAFNSSTAIRNVSIGPQASLNGTTGSENVSIGFQSLFSNTIYERNTAIGFQSLALTSSSNNTAIGYQAGFSLSTNGFGTFVGSLAGQSTTGTGNVFVGYTSGQAVTTGSLNVIIGGYTGNSGGLDIRTSSNNVVLADGQGNIRLYITPSGEVQDTHGKLRSVPQNSKTSAYTLIASDNGKHISITFGGVTVPASVFSTGDVITIFNNSTSSQTITQGASTTLRLAGTSATGNRTLGQYGLCTIMCVALNTFTISGSGLS